MPTYCDQHATPQHRDCDERPRAVCKPRNVIEVAAARLGLERSQLVMIGDSPYDVEAARRAGVDTIGVTTGGFTAEQLAGAVAVFDGPAGLLADWDRSPLR